MNEPIIDESIDDYHAHHAISHSKLRDFVTRGPRYYFLRYVQKDPEALSTPYLRRWHGAALKTRPPP